MDVDSYCYFTEHDGVTHTGLSDYLLARSERRASSVGLHASPAWRHRRWVRLGRILAPC